MSVLPQDGTPDDGFPLPGPDGRPLRIPAAFDGVTDARGPADDPAELRAAFARDGYVVIRGMIPEALCDAAAAAFEAEVKPDPGFFNRHLGNVERHVWTEHGHMRHPIMNIHDLPRRRYPRFVRDGMAVLTHPNVQRVMAALFGEPGKVMHTMFFDGNQVTKPHRDSYVLDAEEAGRLVGVWIALEDIHPGAGRFYVCPGSHRLDLPDVEATPDLAYHKTRDLEAIRDRGLPILAPALRKGDAILWPANTIHGSLETAGTGRSRRCLTAHWIPTSQRFRLFQTRVVDAPTERFNGVEVRHSQDQNVARNRLKFLWQAHHPRSFQAYMRARTGRTG